MYNPYNESYKIAGFIISDIISKSRKGLIRIHILYQECNKIGISNDIAWALSQLLELAAL